MNEKQFQKLGVEKVLSEFYFYFKKRVFFKKEFVFLIPHPLPFTPVKHA